MNNDKRRPLHPDQAVCPHCGKKTEITDYDVESDPNLVAECEHCGGEFEAYYADFVAHDWGEEDDENGDDENA